MADYSLAIDIGGTFTDIVAVDPADGRIAAAFKLPTTPDNPADAIVAGLDRLGAVERVLDELRRLGS